LRVLRSPLVGRKEPLTSLEDIVTRAMDFQAPQLVTIVGNQGTGKTRLINELITRLAANPDRARIRVFHGKAERDSQTGGPIKFAALSSLLRDRFELTPNPDEVTRLRFGHELKTVMGTEQVSEMLNLLGAFVGLEFPPTPFLKAFTENVKLHDEITRTALR